MEKICMVGTLSTWKKKIEKILRKKISKQKFPENLHEKEWNVQVRNLWEFFSEIWDPRQKWGFFHTWFFNDFFSPSKSSFIEGKQKEKSIKVLKKMAWSTKEFKKGLKGLKNGLTFPKQSKIV